MAIIRHPNHDWKMKHTLPKKEPPAKKAVRYPRHSPCSSFWPFQIPVLYSFVVLKRPTSLFSTQRKVRHLCTSAELMELWRREEWRPLHASSTWNKVEISASHWGCASQLSQLSQLSQEMAWKPLRLMKVEVDQVVFLSEHIGSTQFWPPVQFGRCHVTLAQCYSHNFPDMSGPTRSGGS